jgi:DNA-binding transcriptional ArsR family regulator
MKALGDETRLRIVRLLLGSRLGVGQIAEAVGLTPYNVSKHLRILREAGLVESEKRRQQRLYSVAAAFSRHLEEHAQILDLGCCRFDFTKLPVGDTARPG